MTETIYVTQVQFAEFCRKEDAHHKQADTAQDKQAADIAAIRKTLFGNGDPGWDEMLRELYNDYQERKQAKKDADKEKKDETGKYLFWAVTFTAVTVVNVLVTLFLSK